MIRRILKIAAFGTAIIVIAGISAYFTLSLIIKSEDTVIVPDFIGKDVVYVLEYLTELGLNTKVRGSHYSSEFPKNHVIHQDPEPGAEIKKGRDVNISISKGRKTLFMPVLTGLSVLQARIVLEENDLCQGAVTNAYNTGFEKDTVIAQTPVQETVVSRGDCVDLLISLGPRSRTYKMPDLHGLILEEALLAIDKQALVYGEIRSKFISNKPTGRVIDQEPKAGYRVTAQVPVNLVVNRRKTGTGQNGSPGKMSAGLLKYEVDNGFLKRHIRVHLMRPGFSGDIFDDFVRPGREIWLIVPTDKDATVLVYEDEELVRTLSYGPS